MSPLTASVNESSVGALDALVVTVEALVVIVVREPVEPVAHAVSATTKAQNLISLRKCIRNKFEKSFIVYGRMKKSEIRGCSDT